MTAFPPWFVDLLPILAIVIAILLIIVTVIAIRQLRGVAPEPPAPPPVTPTAAPSPTIAAQIKRAADWLATLYGGRNDIDSIPLLVALGAGSAAVQRMLPNLAPGDLTRAQLDLFRGDCRISVCPDGAIVSFEDGLLDSERWEARWAELLRALSKQREDRPFDGLVVMLPAAKLAGPNKLSDDDLAVVGERLYQLLWAAQRASGWRVPIYLVLNQCETLIGFVATAAELPDSMRREPFGWTVPYALDTAFDRGWIREGVEALTARLADLQVRLLIALKDPDNAELVLLFPNALARLATPLSVLLTPMLQPSAYHDAFMFRGFYLTGGPVSAADAVANGASDLFGAQLFTKRIWPEQFLAHPAHGATTRRQRQIHIAQGVLVALAVFAMIGLMRVRSQRTAVKSVFPLTQEIAGLGARAQSAGAETAGTTPSEGATPVPSAQASIEDTKALVEAMSAVSLNRLETAWAPLSYFTNVSTEVEQAIRNAYEVVVLRTVYSSLTDGIPALLGANPPPADTSATLPSELGVTACEADGATSADVDQMARITSRLGDYAQQLNNYQELPRDPQIANLKSLLEFTLSVSLPAGFSTNYYLYEDALRGARAPLLDIGPIRTTVGSILRAQFARALEGAYPGSSLGLAVSGIVANAGVSGFGAPQFAPFQRLRRLDADLHTVTADAPLPQYAWLRDDASAASISTEIARLDALSSRGGVSDLAPVASNLPAQFRRAAADCATATRNRMLAAHVYDGIPVLTAASSAIGLSSPLQTINQALDLFLTQPLATASIASTSPWPNAIGGPLFWDTQDLQSLQADAEAYLLFVAQDLPSTLPTDFREQVQAAAGERLDLLAGDVIARAQQAGLAHDSVAPSGTNTALSEEMARFADAAPILTNLSSLLRGAGRTNSAERLDQLLAGRAILMLRQIDAMLAAGDPYQLVDPTLAFWSGSPPLAAAAFGSATLPDLVGTLPARRDYVESLASDHAAPIVTYLQQNNVLLSNSDRALVTRWAAIISALAGYHRSDPANSLSRLEQFISTDMDKVDLANCRQATAGFLGGSDWFAIQLGNIGRDLRQRCATLTRGESVAQYDDLAESFNTDLAGRFPFGGLSAPDADPNDVKRLFIRFGANLAGLSQELAGIGSYAQAGAPQFVDQLAAVQTALAPMLSNPAANTSLTYDVAIEFRTNSGSDPGANQILEAIAQFGSQRLSSFATSNDLAWSDGQNVRMILRWAKNAPNIPSGNSAQSPQVRDLAVTFEDRGAWALFRMIAAQRPTAAVMAQLSDRRPETVNFVVPLIVNPNVAGPAVPAQCGSWEFWCSNPAPPANGAAKLTSARVFMRLGLIATLHIPGQPDKHQPVTLPLFPTVAPQLGVTNQTAQGFTSLGSSTLQ